MSVTVRSRPSRASGRKAAGVTRAVLAAGLICGQALGGTIAAASVSGVSSAGPAQSAALAASASADWPAYLDGAQHNSYRPAETAITPATAADLVKEWGDTLRGGIVASPTVADGAVFIGSGTGWLFKLDEQTGRILDKVYIGRQPKKTCGAIGVVSTATIAANPATRQPTVYIAGGNGYLYALRASNLSREWRSVIAKPSTKISNYYDWASPAVANGTIYMGVSSNCDQPQIRGGLIAYNQATGKKLSEFYTVPKGRIGASIWSSIGVAADGDVYASTGDGPISDPRLSYSESILKLTPRTLKLLGRFQVPAAQVVYDGDFGSSPVLFGNYVGACDKNGLYYMLHQSTMKVAWERRIGDATGTHKGSCLATPAYNGTDLFFDGNTTTLDVDGTKTTYPGSIQERVATTGALVWATGLAGEAIGSPALDGGGIVTAEIYSAEAGDGVQLVDAATGAIMRQLVAGVDFAQPAFANNWIFTATTNGVYAWGLKSAS